MTEAPTRLSRGPAGDSDVLGTLPAVEAEISAALAGLPPIIRRACERLSGAGGRRFRAQLALLAAGAEDQWTVETVETAESPAIAAAAAVELLHLASLLHDDLLDGARTRRGVPTANADEGDAVALLAGNCVLAAALGCAADAGRDGVGIARQAVLDLCEGAALEQSYRFRTDLAASQILQIARLKAGTLLAAACRLGGVAAGASPDSASVRALGGYGTHLGVALQLLDDLLDVTSTEALLGKPVEADFPNGVITFPALPALAGDPQLRQLTRPGLSLHERRYAMTSIRGHDGPEVTLRLAGEHAERARRLAQSPALRDHPSATALGELPDQLLRTQLQLVDPAVRPVSVHGA